MLNKWFVTFIVCSRILFGSIQNLILKGQGKYKIPNFEGGKPVSFNHPYMQTFFMFMGESFALVPFGVMRLIQIKKKQPLPPCPEVKRQYKFWPCVFFMIPPVLFDFIQTLMYNMGMFYCLSSVHAMLKNLSIVFCALISFGLFRHFREKFDLPNGIGILMLLGGAFMVGAMAIAFPSGDESAADATLGAVLVIIATIIAGCYYTSQEYLLSKLHIEKMFETGVEGVWGLILMGILLPIFNKVKVKGQLMEDLNAWAYQVKVEPLEGMMHFFYAICTMMSSCAGLAISGNLSSASRSTIDACRIILIWIVSFAVKWEKWHNISTPIRFVGFVLIVIGTLAFNNILKIVPYLKKMNIIQYGKYCEKKPAQPGDKKASGEPQQSGGLEPSSQLNLMQNVSVSDPTSTAYRASKVTVQHKIQ